ncbi:MAG: hypothetical protein M3Q30_09235, partial [Actinomycetota bacterium]|nr:hypothetical protein [Actinomycetota bacterium]
AAGDPPRTRQEFGDTKHRVVDYSIRATTRFREYLPRTLTADQLSRDSEPGHIARVNVKSTARPDAPHVLYAVPTFDWPTPVPAPGWPTLEHTRGGGGLRIYVDRPWYSSGAGELLGVVMTANEPSPLPDHLRSRYGLDPTVTGSPAPAVLNLEPTYFPTRTTDEAGILLAEGETLTGTVAGFTPQWDTTRKLWYFDLELTTEDLPWNSWPFLRLALCRYQPNGLDAAKVSKIVLAEFAQVAPERQLSLTWNNPSQLKAVLHGRAPTEPLPPRVAFRIQTTAVPAGTEADELDWDHAAGPDPTVDTAIFETLVQPTDTDGDGALDWEATIDLRAPRHSQRMRLEVCEYELLESDEEINQGAVIRITYAAHIPLD